MRISRASVADFLMKALDINPVNVPAKHNLAAAMLGNGKPHEALAGFEVPSACSLIDSTWPVQILNPR